MNTEELIAELSQNSTPVRRLANPWKRFGCWFAITAGFLLTTTVLSMGIRPDIMSRVQDPVFILELTLVTAFAASAGAACLWLAVPGGDHVWARRLPWALFVLLLGYWGWQLASLPMAAILEYRQVFTECVVELLLLTLVPGILLFFMMRRAATTHYFLAGSLGALAVAGFSYLCLRLAEPTDDLMHLLLWHFIPTLLVGLMGVLAGRLFLRW